MKVSYLILSIGILSACGESTVEDKKNQLNKLRAKVTELNQQIEALESDLTENDPDFNHLANQLTLISTLNVKPTRFEHKFDVRASVASRKNVLISAETTGRIEAIHVKEGQQVKRGQLLVTLDASVLENSLEELKTSLDLATTVYQKRDRLWKQNIGSEIQYLEAKNQMETLQRKLATTKSQLSQYRLVAPFSGVVDNIPAKLGEMAMFGSPMLRILSVDDMHLEADVSEKYLGRLQTGDSVDLYFSAFDKELSSVITSVGNVINQQNRTFSIDVALPDSDIPYKPNLVAVLNITDYYKDDAIVIPSDLIQQDSQGNFVYAVDSSGNQLKAKKISITAGKSYRSQTEITDGIEAGAVLVKAGHREVTDGSLVEIADRESFSANYE